MEAELADELAPDDRPPAWTWLMLVLGGFLILAGLGSFLTVPAGRPPWPDDAPAALFAVIGVAVVALGIRYRAAWTPTGAPEEGEWPYRWTGFPARQWSPAYFASGLFFAALAVLLLLLRMWLLGALLAVPAACALVLGIMFARPGATD